MTHPTPSRRQFVQWAAGLTVALGHGWLPGSAQAETAPAGTPHPEAAVLGDARLRIEFDSHMNARLVRVRDGEALTEWRPCNYLLLKDSGHATHFALRRQSRSSIEDRGGAGTRLTLEGVAANGLEQRVQLSVYERYPGFIFSRVTYLNATANAMTALAWTNGDYLLRSHPSAPGFWSYTGGTHEDRRDWVQPVKAGFMQDNYLGMTASDYGSGIPVVDVWRRDGGLAVGHVETTPKRISLPVQERQGSVRLAACSQEKFALAAGADFTTLETFVAVHEGDYFSTLNTYRLIMAERGLHSPTCGPACYEPIWCAWGYERECTTELIEGTLSKVKELGLKWAVLDDGWQSNVGDWNLNAAKYPRGEADMKGLVASIESHGLRPRLWYSPLSVAPGADLLHDHPDMLLLDKDGAPQLVSWWNSLYLCPAYSKTIENAQGLVRKFLGDWKFAGLKIDGQHLNGVAPCFNPAHHHASPNDSVEGLQNFFRALYQTAIEINPNAVVELCPCGTSYSIFNMPYLNQAPASDPESSWQVRLKGKTLKALMGPSAPFAGDHVELSDHGDDFASTVGVGGIISTKFTWPVDPKPKDSFLLTPEREREWRHWISIYNEKMLPTGIYRGELYDIGFDKPEAHVVEKSGRLYYAFYAPAWSGDIALRGLTAGSYRIRDYIHDRDLGRVTQERNKLNVKFEQHLLLEAIPA